MPRCPASRHLLASCQAAIGMVVLACTAATAQNPCPIELRNVTEKTAVAFRHTDGSSGRRYIVETVSAGLATFDYDGDGYLDIYFLNGAPLEGTRLQGPPPRNALYRNLGNWRFVDVTQRSGLGDPGYALGVAVADYDNDGHPDVYVTNFGPNVLYRGNGDGTFSDVTSTANVGNGSKVGAGACFLDADHDGHLDLFVASYLKFSFDKHVSQTLLGFPYYASPSHYLPEPASLFHNRGNRTFVDVSESSGIAARPNYGMGVVATDYDNDGDTDIFVANDVTENYLWRNDGAGKFEEVGLAAGIAVDIDGQGHGNMGVDCADYNNDGLMDFYVTSFQNELATLYRNLGHGVFDDVTRLTGAGAGTLAQVTWGCGIVDFDNDGYRDIYVACGHLQDNIDQYDDTTSYLARNILLRNTGDGKFVNVTDRAGDGMQVRLSSRGATFDDLDNDGDIDVVVLNSRREPTILRNMLNENGSKNHWIQVQLRGTKSNRDGVGARVKVTAGNLTQVDEVHSGRSYQSHFGTRLHFGLGERGRIDRMEIRWPSGMTDVLPGVAVDKRVTIVEGKTGPEPKQ